MNILVTGASGFIGRHVLAAASALGLRPLPLVRAGSNIQGLEAWRDDLRVADLRDDQALRSAVEGVDAVIHLAGLTRAPSLSAFLEVNAEAVARLVRACTQAATPPRRFLLVSSLSAGGPAPLPAPRRETDAPAPCSRYGLSKLRGEEALRHQAGRMAWTIVRPPLVYGPWERDLLSVFQMCRQGLVPVVGFAEKHYSLVYAPDLAHSLVKLLAEPRAAGEVFHLAEERPYAYREIVSTIGAAVGRVPRMFRVPHLVARLAGAAGSLSRPFRRRPGLVTLDKMPEILAPGWICSTEKVRSLLGDVCGTRLEEGARLTARWYREHGWLR